MDTEENVDTEEIQEISVKGFWVRDFWTPPNCWKKILEDIQVTAEEIDRDDWNSHEGDVSDLEVYSFYLCAALLLHSSSIILSCSALLCMNLRKKSVNICTIGYKQYRNC